MKVEFKCPWCGTDFQNGKELDTHAKKHYREATILSVIKHNNQIFSQKECLGCDCLGTVT